MCETWRLKTAREVRFFTFYIEAMWSREWKHVNYKKFPSLKIAKWQNTLAYILIYNNNILKQQTQLFVISEALHYQEHQKVIFWAFYKVKFLIMSLCVFISHYCLCIFSRASRKEVHMLKIPLVKNNTPKWQKVQKRRTERRWTR